MTQKSIYWFSVANTLDLFLVAIGLLFLYKRCNGQRLKFKTALARKLLVSSKYYIISDLMVVVFAQTDRVMLKTMIDNSATGYYSAAITCAGMTSFVFTAIIDSMRPVIFEGKKTSEKVYLLNLERLFSIIIYLSLAQCIIITVLAPFIILVLYGNQYRASISALQIVVWYTTFSYLGGARNIWILAERKQKYLLRINLVGVMANILLNIMLIPVLGINGAALASLITQFLTNVVTGYIYKPVRGVNSIMLQGLDPRFVIDSLKTLISIVKKK